MLDRILVLSVFVVASCGLAYELVAGALSSYLLGDSVLQFSTIIGTYLFAMGVGAHLSRHIDDRDALARFVDVELMVGVLGGCSATLLFMLFAWMSAPFRGVLYIVVFLIGVLVGLEIPLVMRVLNQQQASFRELVSRVLTFDYLGALAVSLLFPLVLAPYLGLARTTFLFGLLNTAVALWTTWHFRAQLPRVTRRLQRGALVFIALFGGLFGADHLTYFAEQRVFGDPIVYSRTTPYQRIILTRWHDDIRLYLNGNLQFSSRDEYRYHEALVLPALQALPGARRVLVLGGGDGMALREILKYPHIESVTLVDLDPAMPALFSSSSPLRALNGNAYADPRVQVIHADAAQWLEGDVGNFDLIIADFPDPSNYGLGKLFSVPVYRLMAHHLAAGGYLVVQSTSPFYAPHAFWCVDATLKAAGFNTWPYHVYVPSFGEWGFVLAGLRPGYTPPTQYSVSTRFLAGDNTREMFRFPADMQPPEVEPNYLNTQPLVRYFTEDWGRVIR